jgi:hypothetical protein
MITINSSGSINIPQDPIIADGVWITQLLIRSPSIEQPVSARMQLCPYNSTTNILYTDMTQIVNIPDVYATAETNPLLANAMGAIFAYVQDYVISQSLFQ